MIADRTQLQKNYLKSEQIVISVPMANPHKQLTLG